MGKLDLDSNNLNMENEKIEVQQRSSFIQRRMRIFNVDFLRIVQVLWAKKYYAITIYIVCVLSLVGWYLFFAKSAIDEKWTAVTSVVYNKPSSNYNFKINDISTVVQLLYTQQLCENVLKERNMPHSNGNVREMLSHLTVETSRRKPNIIDISVNYNSEKEALALSESFARECINVYNKYQNDAIDAMNAENNRKMQTLKSQLYDVQATIRKFQAGNEMLNVGDTVESFRQSVLENLKKISNTTEELHKVEIRREILKDKLSNYSDESFARDIILQIKKSETDLMALRETYTDDHHKVISLVNQINAMKHSIKYTDGADKESKKINESMTYELFAELNNDMIKAEVEHKFLSETLKLLKEKEKVLENNYDNLTMGINDYTSAIDKKKLLIARIEKLAKDMDDLESQKNSGIPDIYILESFVMREIFNVIAKLIKIALLGLLVFFFYFLIIIGYYVLRMRIISSREFTLCYDIDNIGELSDDENMESPLSMASLQKAWLRIHSVRGDSKNLLAINTMTDENLNKVVKYFSFIADIHGIKRCAIRIGSMNDIPKDSEKSFYIFEDGSKFENLFIIDGVLHFIHENEKCLNYKEMEVFKGVMEKIGETFDVLVWNFQYKNLKNWEIILQLESLMGYVYIVCKYNAMNKFHMENLLSEATKCRRRKMGGLLLGVPKKYFYINT